MPNENTIVDRISRIDPPLGDRSGAEVLRENPDGVAISFAEATAVRIVPGDIAAGTLEIIDQLRQLAQPAYVEFAPDTRVVVRLLIPLVTGVSGLAEDAGVVRVTLDASHAAHVVERDSPDFDELRTTLADALAARATVVVTETDDHRIIDVRRWPGTPFPPAPSVTPTRPSIFVRLWRWLCGWLRCWLWCVSPDRAQQLFDQMNAQTCNPLTVPMPCIPFLYPDDGCWARAHEMCRLLLAQGARPRKIWIDGTLNTPTRNHPNCVVHWGWHVAPTLCVHRRWRWWPCSLADVVIDPSLFTAPVPLATWKAVQGDPNATLTPSDASLYWRNAIPTDPAYVDTNYRLAYYRLQLKNRSLQPAGPPPYAFCP